MSKRTLSEMEAESAESSFAEPSVSMLVDSVSAYERGESEGLEALVACVMRRFEDSGFHVEKNFERLPENCKETMRRELMEARRFMQQLRVYYKNGSATEYVTDRDVIAMEMRVKKIAQRIDSCNSPYTRWSETHSEESEVSRMRSRFLQLDSADSTLTAIKESTAIPDAAARIIDEMALLDETHTVKLLECSNAECVNRGIHDICEARGYDWLVNDLVAADEMGADNWLFDLIDLGLIVDRGHIRDENKRKEEGDEYRRVHRSDICCGDLICVEFIATHCTRWISAMFVASGGDRLHKVGLRRVKQSDPKYCTPVVIPSFVSRRFVDPLTNYATLIHQSSFSNSCFGTLNFELQLHASVFQRMMSAVTSLSEASLGQLREKYKWATSDSTYDRNGTKKGVSGPFASASNAQVSRTDEEKQADVYSFYLSLARCGRFALLGFSNHPQVPELDCSRMSDSTLLDKMPFYYMPSLMQLPAERSKEEVKKLLASLGYSKTRGGNCVREALRMAHFPLEGLTADTVLVSKKCPLCQKTELKYTLDDAMNERTVPCVTCNNFDWHVANLCRGTAFFWDRYYQCQCRRN